MSDEVKVKKKRISDGRRVRLSDKAYGNVTKWVEQVDGEYGGMLSIKLTEVVNFVLEGLSPVLSKQQMAQLKEEKLTGAQKAKWLYAKCAEAEKNGLEIDFNGLLKRIQSGGAKTKKKPNAKQNKEIQVCQSEGAKNSPKLKKVEQL